MPEDKPSLELVELTTNLVSAHIANNSVAMADLPQLIREVYGTLSSLGQEEKKEPERPTPAVSIKKSITPEFIICLEDGKKLKMLKRHLKTAYNMTPEEYRERGGLSAGDLSAQKAVSPCLPGAEIPLYSGDVDGEYLLPWPFPYSSLTFFAKS